MANRLIPPPELAPSLPPGTAAHQGIELWTSLVDACEEFLLAGLRRQFGSPQDLRAALREVYAAQQVEHDRAMLHLLQDFNRRSPVHGR